MIRGFVLLGIVGGLLVAWLTTLGVGPIGQLPPPKSLVTEFREQGVLPEEVNLEEDEAVEEMHVFEVPESDEEQLKIAMAAYEKMMGGMDMGGMKMDQGSDSSMKMGEGSDGSMKMEQGSDGSMKMEQGSDGGTMQMAQGDQSGGMKMDESATGPKAGAHLEKAEAEGGLLFMPDGAYDREITLTMSEWKFSDMMIDVKPGERIKFTVKNGGQIPHEFMFMSPPLMNAVTYRAIRADWNLYEHEALYERALVLPGGEFSFVMEVEEPGSWMFMCMLPYHMQMGMMGQMATEGMAMKM